MILVWPLELQWIVSHPCRMRDMHVTIRYNIFNCANCLPIFLTRWKINKTYSIYNITLTPSRVLYNSHLFNFAEDEKYRLFTYSHDMSAIRKNYPNRLNMVSHMILKTRRKIREWKKKNRQIPLKTKFVSLAWTSRITCAHGLSFNTWIGNKVSCTSDAVC